MEVIVIDGGSTDRTQEIVSEYIDKFPQVRLLQNPAKIVPAAINLAAKSAAGEVLVWVGAHARYAPDYVPRSVSLLLETGAASVGGKLTAVGNGRIGESIAFALSLSTGTGNAKYRSGADAGWVDTVFGGCWWKEDFLAIGGFDERWVVNQDTEFNFRLREEIGGIYFSPEITCEYFVRNSIQGLAKQYLRYGIWRARTFLRHPASLKPRQLLPACFVAALAMSLLATPWTMLPISGLLVIYSAALIFVLSKARKVAFSTKSLAFFCTAVLHISWGSGFIAGLLTGQPASIDQ